MFKEDNIQIVIVFYQIIQNLLKQIYNTLSWSDYLKLQIHIFKLFFDSSKNGKSLATIEGTTKGQEIWKHGGESLCQ